MKDRNRNRQNQNTPDPSEESEVRQNPITQGRVDRHYESGRNPDMQAQRSNRQGDGNPTQQRRDDR
ncbi:MAG: hypothetical protein ABI645_06980 [Pseudomonadota bacterium]